MTVNDHLDCFEPELVVIPCGSRKLDRRAPAGDLYVGSYHRACRRAAEALEPGRLLILSARYGLLDLDDVVEPYDTPHGAAGSITADALLEQARRRGALLDGPVVALGGARHVSLVRSVWPGALSPLAATRGVGEQMARLAAMRKHTAAPVRRNADPSPL
ncbi:DUF6884 domain-containing protein [Streptomyces sp. NPDC127036]|uniref:DUF6884 domain-containing protein n=1 Tax=Streptomyces sp. NPDC127036 TaxID=3347112 RepID=UPI00365DAF7C